MKDSKQINDPDLEEALDEMSKGTWKPSLRYRWVRWYQYTWLGKIWFSLKAGIPNLWKWRKVVWEDHDWDYRHIYDVMYFKIKNTADYIEKHDRFVGVEHEVAWMRKCLTLIERVSDESYEMEHMDYKDMEMVFTPTNDGTGSSLMEFETHRDDSEDYISKYPLWEKRAIEYIRKNQHRYTVDETDRGHVARIMAQLRQEKAKKLMFQIMEWRIERWWD
jgi:hypothetical protein